MKVIHPLSGAAYLHNRKKTQINEINNAERHLDKRADHEMTV